MQINKKQILEICKVSWTAGKKILNIYSKEFEIFRKKDMSPVTLADLESEKIIIKGLKEIFKKPVIFSEETNNKNIGNSNNFWLVDPLDGTKEFIKKNGEFTINIAYIENRKPVLGIIYAPVINKTFVGVKENTYKILNKNKFKKIIPKKNSKKIMIISRSHSSKSEQIELIKKYKITKVLFLGSALKFCYVAEGKAHIYPRSGTTYEWDTAAGHAIINGVGGKIETSKGIELKYGKKDFKNSNFIAKTF